MPKHKIINVNILFSLATFLPGQNTVMLATDDFRRENTTRKKNHLISACRALLNIVKYVICGIHSIHTIYNGIYWWEAIHSIYLIKKTHAAFYWCHGSSMRRTNGRSSIVQQSGALLKPLLVVYFKKMQTIG